MNYTLKNGKEIELAPEDLEGITWMCWKQTFRDMADDFLSWYSSDASLYTEDAKDELAERITNYYFSDEDLDSIKARHAEEVIEEMDEELKCNAKKCICEHYSSQDYKILTWNKENYEELLSSFTDDELCEMYYFVYHHPACPMAIHSCSDDWESKYIIVYEYKLFCLPVGFELSDLLHGVFLCDTLNVKPVEERPKIADVIVDRRDADRLSEIPAPVRMVCLLLFVVAVESVFPSLLEIVDVPTNHAFGNLVHIVDHHLFFAPALKEAKRLFVRRHCFFPELAASTVDHEFINLPIK